ncbi:DMT family transporter [Shimia sp. FJ5]|uniref:DMT family transporter n=1 Tax=Shimia sp. FJ5 TaxID=3079054 RepID=UPI002612CCEA|nr:DMT family transporter [Shimia sp. FJ5]MDV4145910.1 DMT family transporter [Shimia sp. FJ5]
MKLLLLTALTMAAFAANSVLNRLALADGAMSAEAFGVLRLVSGAVMLLVLLALRRQEISLGGWRRVWPVAALLAYIFGFSTAYAALAPGFGALILFSVVQATMFLGALVAREDVPPARWAGAGLGLIGLAWLLWPVGGVVLSWPHIFAMAVAGIGWGLYSLFGRRAGDPLQATALNFAFAAIVAVIWLLMSGGLETWPLKGVILAAVSGAITSGLGYALWYHILPALGATRAAVAQLSVPVIALAGGALLVDEPLTLRFALASVLVMGGVLLSLRRG